MAPMRLVSGQRVIFVNSMSDLFQAEVPLALHTTCLLPPRLNCPAAPRFQILTNTRRCG
jgi:protein gp37